MLHETDNSFYLQIYGVNGKSFSKVIIWNLFLECQPNSELWWRVSNKDEKVNYKGLRVCYTKILFEGNLFGFIQLATPTTSAHNAIDDIIAFNLWTLPLAFILFILVSLFFVKQSLNPINKIITITEEITATNIKSG